MTRLQEVANRKSDNIQIELEDMKEFFTDPKDHGFVDRVRLNTARYQQIFSTIIDQNMPQPSIQISEEDQTAFDVVMQQRRFNAEQAKQTLIAQGLVKNGDNQ